MIQTGFSLVFVLLGVVAIAAAVNNAVKVNKIRNSTPATIAEARGMSQPVSIQGVIKPTSENNTMVDPYSGDDCVAYHFRVRKRRRQEGSSSDRRLVDKERESTDFVISDETGTAYVDPDPTQLSMEEERDTEIKQGSSFVQRYSPMDWGWKNFKFYYTGRSLKPDETVTVLGSPEPVTGVNADVSLTDSDSDLLVSDQNPRNTTKRLVIQSLIFGTVGLLFVVGFGYLLVT